MDPTKEHTINNLQNLVSLCSISDLDGMQQAGKVLLRMNELAKLSLDITKQDTDRSNYDYEFKELAFELDSINQKKFNGLELFSDGPFSNEKSNLFKSSNLSGLKPQSKSWKID